MEFHDAALMRGVQFIFDPVAKTAMVIRDETMIAVPGRFASSVDAQAACMRMLRAKYQDAYVHEM
jgi:hypothetical protein